ncbi:MAG: fumarate hydratase [Eggerthellaceae bacterium]
MLAVTPASVASALASLIPRLASVLPDDVLAGLMTVREGETSDRARVVLDQLVENASIAATDSVPICQDTGTVWVCLEVGPDVLVPGNVFSSVNDAVAQAYDQARLRKSLVKDALFDRDNTGDNTPAFCEIHCVDEPGVARLHVMLKGGGSDNASRVVMLTPSAGKQGVIDTVLACVREKAANACPPLIVGVGVGATFDKVGGLAKHALMRPLGQPHPDPKVAEFEAELLSAINATGIGAGALGGATTALGVRVETASCHIAALPVAVNMGCSAMRRGSVDLSCVELGDAMITALKEEADRSE